MPHKRHYTPMERTPQSQAPLGPVHIGPMKAGSVRKSGKGMYPENKPRQPINQEEIDAQKVHRYQRRQEILGEGTKPGEEASTANRIRRNAIARALGSYYERHPKEGRDITSPVEREVD